MCWLRRSGHWLLFKQKIVRLNLLLAIGNQGYQITELANLALPRYEQWRKDFRRIQVNHAQLSEISPPRVISTSLLPGLTVATTLLNCLGDDKLPIFAVTPQALSWQCRTQTRMVTDK